MSEVVLRWLGILIVLCSALGCDRKPDYLHVWKGSVEEAPAPIPRPHCRVEPVQGTALVGEPVAFTLQRVGITTSATLNGELINLDEKTSVKSFLMKEAGSFVVQGEVRGPGGRGTCEAKVEVREPRPRCRVSALPLSVLPGETVRVRLETEGKVSTARLDGQPAEFPLAVIERKAGDPGEYRVKAEVEGPGGSGSCEAGFTVREPAPSCVLSAKPDSILLGESLTLELSTTGAVSTAFIEDKTVSHPSGTLSVRPAIAGTFTAHGRVSGPGGMASCQVSYTVRDLPPRCSLSATPLTVFPQEGVRLQLHTEGKVSEARINGTVVSFPDGAITVSQSGAGTYTAQAVVRGPGGTATCEATYVVKERAPTCTVEADPGSVLEGERMTLRLHGAGKITSAFIDDNPVGYPEGAHSFISAGAGMFTVHARVIGPGGASGCQTVYRVKALPPKCQLTAQPAAIMVGEKLQLVLRTEGKVSSATIDGTAVVPPSASKLVTASEAGVFQAEAVVVGPGGTARCFASYAVTEPPPRCTVTATPSSVYPGQGVVLRLQAEGKVSGAWIDGDPVSAPGQKSVMALSAGSFTVHGKVSGPGGTAECGTSYVVQELAPGCTISAAPNPVRVGEPLELTLIAEGKATSGTIEGQSVSVPLGKHTLIPTSSGTFVAHAEVSGPGGGARCEISYVVKELPPFCQVAASPSQIQLGGSVTLAFTTSGKVTSAQLDGEPIGFPSANRTVTPTASGMFKAHGEVSGPEGSSICETAYAVQDQAPLCTLSASPSVVETGGAITLRLTATGNATRASIDGTSVAVPEGTKLISGGAPGMFVAHGLVEGAGGKSGCDASYLVKAIPPPRCTLNASPASITVGQKVLVVMHAEGAISGTIDGETIPVPEGSRLLQPDKEGTFTARGEVSGAGGTASCQASYSVGGALPKFQPALAVAASGCIMCHAKINSNIITTFGADEPSYFFGKGFSALMPGGAALHGAIYGDWIDCPIPSGSKRNWGSAKVYGKVIVPNAPIPSGSVGGVTAASLADYLRGAIEPPDPGLAKPQVVEMEKVYIGAPTAEQILSAAGAMPPEHPDWKYLPAPGASPTLQGLIESGGSLHNDPSRPLICDGDLVIRDRVLVLKELRLDTRQGCRIYGAGKSVMLHGKIELVGERETSNLQITSSRAILAGLGKGAVDLGPSSDTGSDDYRLRTHFAVGGFFTHLFPNDPLPNLSAILEDSKLAALDDATKEPGGRSVPFRRLLLNAPVVQSRYNGNFTGVIVGEVVLASFGDFVFQFDPVFSKVPVLPLVPQSSFLDVR